jgi:hypothetical protein
VPPLIRRTARRSPKDDFNILTIASPFLCSYSILAPVVVVLLAIDKALGIVTLSIPASAIAIKTSIRERPLSLRFEWFCSTDTVLQTIFLLRFITDWLG